MEDFYDSIKNNLENRPEPSFKEEAWKAMEGKLNDFERSQARVVVWPWWSYAMLALLPMSILLNAWLIWGNTDESSTISGKSNALVLVDTVFKTQVIYQRDTLVQTRVIKELLAQRTNGAFPGSPTLVTDLFEAQMQAWQLQFADLEPKSDLLSNPIVNDAGRAASIALLRKDLGSATQPDKVALSTGVRTNLLEVKAQPISDQRYLQGPENMEGLPITEFAYTPPPIWESLRPTGATIGTQMGLLIPTTKGMIDPHAFERSLQLKLKLPNHLAIWGELGLIDIKYRLEEIGEAVDIDRVEPPATGFNFNDVQVWQERTHLAVGLEYAFPTKGRSSARPAVALGYNALGFRPYEIFHEFRNPDTGIEIQVEENIDRTDGPMHYLATRASYQWPIGRRGIWGLSLHYRMSLMENRFTNPNMVGVTSSFALQF